MIRNLRTLGALAASVALGFLLMAPSVYALGTATPVQQGGIGNVGGNVSSTGIPAGDLIVGQGSSASAFSLLAPGTSGYVLTSNGNGSAPSFQLLPTSSGFSTTSANYWLTTKSTSNLAEGTNLYFTNARAQAAISLTTTGTSGAATYSGGVLNVPQYAGTTYTAGTGLTLTTGAFSVNTSQNILSLTNLGSGLVSSNSGVLYNTSTSSLNASITGNAATVTNGVYTTTFNGLFDNRLSATTSLPNILTLAGLSLPYSQLTGVPAFDTFGYPFPSNATTSSLTFGGVTVTGAATGCATFTTGVLSSTGVACGSGTGGAAYPFTPSTDGGIAVSATSTPISGTNPGLGLDVAATSWYGIGGKLLGYASSTNRDVIFGLNAGGQNATTSATLGQNDAFGSFNLIKNTTGTNNTSIGDGSLEANTTGSYNVSLGSSVLDNNISGNGNMGIGYLTLNNTTGSNNVAIGVQSGYSVSSGYSNTLIGNNSVSLATTISSGFGNVGIGSNIFFPSATGNLQLNIGNLIFGTLPATTTAFALPTSGSVGIGTSSPYAKFAIQANNGDTATTLFAIGSSTSGATTTLFSVSNTGAITTNLSGSGFVKTSGAGSALTVDTNTYLTGNQTVTLSGDVSGSGATAITTAIGANKVTLGDIAQVGANTILGNGTGATGNVTALSTSTLNIGGNAGTATALAANGSNCAAGFYAAGVDASGNAEGCAYHLATTTPWSNGGLVAINATGVGYDISTTSLNASITGQSGSVANALTINSPLTGSSYNGSAGVSIGCQTASGSQAGCVSSTDWTTFNNKQATVSATYPVQISSNVVSLGFGTTTQNFWSAYNNFSSLFATNASTTNSTSTNIYASSHVGIASTTVSSGNVLDVGGNAIFSGTVTANNFFDTSVNGNTCIGESGGLIGTSNCVASLASSGSTITVSSPTGNVNVDLNLSHSNGWLSLQTFTNSSTTLASVTSKLYVGGTSTTTIDSAGNVVIPSGASLTNNGVSNGCATFASGVLGTTGSPCGTSGGITALGNYSTTTGTAISLSTTTLTVNGQTLGLDIIPAANGITFVPTLTGTLNNAGLTNSTISGVALGSTLNSLSTNSSLTGTSYNGSAAVSNWGLNLTNANSWSALQTFANATTTLLSASYASSTAAYFGTLNLPGLTGTQCLHEISGVVSGTGSDCGSGSGAAYPFFPSTDGGINTSATTTAIEGAAIGLGLDVPTTSWYGQGGSLFAYGSSTNRVTVLGYHAGGNSATTSATIVGNTALGYQTLTQNTGQWNTAVGQNTLFANTSGNFNTGVGDAALYQDTTGLSNTGVGEEALYAVTIGNWNTAVGNDAMNLGTITGGGNTAVGAFAMNTGGSDATNTAMGYGSQSVNTSGIYNSSYGAYSLLDDQSGNKNSALGVKALELDVSGSSNVAIGYTAGLNETGSNDFYVNNVAQASLANDKTYSLLYGNFSGTAASLTGQQLTVNGTFNVFGGGAADVFTVTQAGNASSTNITDSALTSGNCVQASTAGLLTTTGSACGSGGGIGDPFTHPATGQSATTSLMLFNGNASSTQISAATGFFNSIVASSTTATSTFANAVLIGTTTETSVGIDSTGSFMQVVSNALTSFGGLLINTATNVTNALTIKNSSGTTVFNVDDTGTLPWFGVGTTTAQQSTSLIATFVNTPVGNGTNASTTINLGAIGTTTSRMQFNIKSSSGSDDCMYVNNANSLTVQSGACNP